MPKKRKGFNPSGIVLTPEQDKIVNHDFKPGDCIVIRAYAGTGKTFTLQMLSYRLELAHPEWKILYLAFNKAVQKEAEKKFNDNVEARTTHSIAWDIGKKYSHKLESNIRLTHIVEIFEKELKEEEKWQEATFISQTLKNFMYSADPKVSKIHFADPKGQFRKYVSKPDTARKYLDLCNKLWSMMCDEENERVPMMHDGYLKLYQLTNPDLSQYDVILTDESQDINPTTNSIIEQQKCIKIYVGDSNQKIYGFRGSEDAFGLITPTHTYTLSQSFRFGDAVAEVANSILQKWKGEKIPLVGLNKGDEIVDSEEDFENYTIITRTNAQLFLHAIDFMNKKILFGIVGGISGIDFSTIFDVYNLWRKRRDKINSKFILYFKDYSELLTYAKESNDPEIMRIKILLDTYGGEIPHLIQQIKLYAEPNLEKATVILTTAHKSKGLEFVNVVLAEDFDDLSVYTENLRPEEEDLNILYVAATRALKRLKLNHSLQVNLLKYREDNSNSLS